ncbi:hypothetical protein JCGZ_24505 [Jatropha curcas]|uniref:Uncharacterized protein n=1 Tax=Jatropha curcas TaxID=180498 RepID=A0A067KWB7_JATCU|nr:BAHD acyltransferase At5g47980 [Jatropha curcas]KDP40506.1 hypothetical protein JCGZ_24505 [Jatropha curcas]
MESLNQFLPCEPFCQQSDPTLAQLAVQVNIFDSGGIAIGMGFSHKINDGITGSSFIKSWAANSRGSYNNVINANLSDASLSFPSQESLPPKYTSLMESLWFGPRKFSTGRFVFGANAIAILTNKGRSELIWNPTRVEAPGAFIWRCAMKACTRVSGTLKPSVMSQAVNIRRLTKRRLSRYSIGNLVWSAIASYKPNKAEMGIQEFVALVRGGVARINSDYLKTMSGNEGSIAIFEHLNGLAEIASENPDVFSFFSWHTFDFSDIDIGWEGLFGLAFLERLVKTVPVTPIS